MTDTAPAPPKRTRARQQRAEDTRQAILDAATIEFADNGYDGAATRAVAARAGVNQPLVTYHFGSKEGLWRAVIQALIADYRAQYEAHLTEVTDLEPVARLRVIQEEFIRFSANGTVFHQIMAHVARKPSEQLTWMVEEYLRDVYETRAELIRAAQAAGKYVAGDPFHLQYLFLGAVTRIYLLAAEVEQVAGFSPSDPDFLDEHVRVCLSLFFRD
ncbi:MAG: TetR family transcriptional regulator [Phenylobacterium sp.]|uniref:TetR/AcrR family transcriptional regulator n=1 Tax=Phenylobacterium sp. TaxID=1871053 RepID=UPI0025DE6496|nr:TetR family transcriptional regulator [Phenylobacterium sp.]MBI1196953.1 TetR family transcriptional regulator [Phenylobacterium sp.]